MPNGIIMIINFSKCLSNEFNLGAEDKLDTVAQWIDAMLH